MMEHHKAIIWIGAAVAAGALYWYLESGKLHAASLTALGAGDPQSSGGQVTWLGLPPSAPSNATDQVPLQILTTSNAFLPGANQPFQTGVPQAPAAPSILPKPPANQVPPGSLGAPWGGSQP